MAKEQNLSLNPTKISGVCGRLMCCLKNEEETYEYLNSRLPSIGDMVTAKDGTRGEVTGVNVLRQLVKVVVDNGEEKELKEISVDDLSFRPRKRKDIKLTEEELKELEGLEDDTNEQIADSKPEKKEYRDRRGNNNRNNRYNSNKDNENNNNRNYDKKPRYNRYDKNGKNGTSYENESEH
jgi:hypothetical protein